MDEVIGPQEAAVTGPKLSCLCVGAEVARSELEPGSLTIAQVFSALYPMPHYFLPHLFGALMPESLTGSPWGCVILGRAGHPLKLWFPCL